MLTANVGSDVTLGGAVLAIIVIFIGAVATISIALGRRTENTRQQQDSAITALQGQVTALESDRDLRKQQYDAQVRLLNEQNRALQKQVDTLTEQVHILNEQVTQVAKVDLMRDEMRAGFKQVNESLAVIRKAP